MNLQNIRLAADLAILDVVLPASGGRIHRRLVPFSTTGALEARGHAHWAILQANYFSVKASANRSI
jgi:hypothetical protein